MAENVVKICTQSGCLKYNNPSEDDVAEAVRYIESNGDEVLFTDKCQQVCDILGHRAMGGIASAEEVALCVVAGDAYRIAPILLDYMGMSGVIGHDQDGVMKLALLNQRAYPPVQQ